MYLFKTLESSGLGIRSRRCAEKPECGSEDFWIVFDDFGAAKAGEGVIVEHSGRLHVGLADDRADELKSAAAEIFAEPDRFGSCRREIFGGFKLSDDWTAFDKAPDVVGKGSEFRFHFEKAAGVVDRCGDFPAVSDQAAVVHQIFDLSLVELRHFFRIELSKCVSVVFSSLENRIPAETGLGGFESQKLEDRPVVENGNSPFAIVVFDVIRFGEIDPFAAAFFFVAGHFGSLNRKADSDKQ